MAKNGIKSLAKFFYKKFLKNFKKFQKNFKKKNLKILFKKKLLM